MGHYVCQSWSIQWFHRKTTSWQRPAHHTKLLGNSKQTSAWARNQVRHSPIAAKHSAACVFWKKSDVKNSSDCSVCQVLPIPWSMKSTDILALRRFCLREVRRSEQKATQARLNDMTSQDEGWLQHESTLCKPMFKEKRGTLSFFIDIYI